MKVPTGEMDQKSFFVFLDQKSEAKHGWEEIQIAQSRKLILKLRWWMGFIFYECVWAFIFVGSQVFLLLLMHFIVFYRLHCMMEGIGQDGTKKARSMFSDYLAQQRQRQG